MGPFPNAKDRVSNITPKEGCQELGELHTTARLKSPLISAVREPREQQLYLPAPRVLRPPDRSASNLKVVGCTVHHNLELWKSAERFIPTSMHQPSARPPRWRVCANAPARGRGVGWRCAFMRESGIGKYPNGTPGVVGAVRLRFLGPDNRRIIMVFNSDGELWRVEARGHGPHGATRRRARSPAERVRARPEVDLVVNRGRDGMVNAGAVSDGCSEECQWFVWCASKTRRRRTRWTPRFKDTRLQNFLYLVRVHLPPCARWPGTPGS